MKIGTKVTVERDEKKYPPRGSWKYYRGRKGTVTGTAGAGSEIGVSFSNGGSADAYLKRHELKERKR